MSDDKKPTLSHEGTPYLPNPGTRLDYLAPGYVRPTTSTPAGPSSKVHFVTHVAMPEIRAVIADRGWAAQGFTKVSITWQELHATSDGWKTVHVVKSTDVPCPVVDDFFTLAKVAPETEVEFALHVGLACHAPTDTAGARDVAQLWLNNRGRNYRQVTR